MCLADPSRTKTRNNNGVSSLPFDWCQAKSSQANSQICHQHKKKNYHSIVCYMNAYREPYTLLLIHVTSKSKPHSGLYSCLEKKKQNSTFIYECAHRWMITKPKSIPCNCSYRNGHSHNVNHTTISNLSLSLCFYLYSILGCWWCVSLFLDRQKIAAWYKKFLVRWHVHTLSMLFCSNDGDDRQHSLILMTNISS